MLAQLCPEEGEQQKEQHHFAMLVAAAQTTAATAPAAITVKEAQEVIHVIRFPDLLTRIQPANNITMYYLQKLQEVGYRGIQTVNSTEVRLNLTNPQTNETITTGPGQICRNDIQH